MKAPVCFPYVLNATRAYAFINKAMGVDVFVFEGEQRPNLGGIPYEIHIIRLTDKILEFVKKSPRQIFIFSAIRNSHSQSWLGFFNFEKVIRNDLFKL